jgi:hypothetical protein
LGPISVLKTNKQPLRSRLVLLLLAPFGTKKLKLFFHGMIFRKYLD